MSGSDDESHSSSDETAKSRALPIGDLPRNFDPNKPPTSAEEYLHHVMWEASQCDSVVTVKLNQSRIKKPTPVVRPNIKEQAPAVYCPDDAAQRSIMQQFLSTRDQVDNLKKSVNKPKPPLKFPTSENPNHWCEYCLGTTAHQAILQLQRDKAGGAGSSKPSSRDPVEPQQPLLSVLLNVKQATLQNLMEWHVGWLELAGFSEHQGKWLYSLLTCLEKPLIPELCDNVRQIVFLCARARAGLDSSSHPFLPQLNLIITIITRFFNQDDLVDPR